MYYQQGLNGWADILNAVSSGINRVSTAVDTTQRVVTAARQAGSQPTGMPALTAPINPAAPTSNLPSWLLPAAAVVVGAMLLPRLLRSGRR